MNRIRQAARKVLPLVALAVFSLGVSVVAAEIAVRILAPQQLILLRADVWQPADTVGWLHRPLVNTTINTGERTVRFRTDAGGFRIGAETPPPAKRRILMLGDSFIEALQVEHEQSVAGLLQERLSDAVGEPVRVVNAGVGGWGPGQYLARTRTLLAEEVFDLVVVVLYVGNDVERTYRDYFPPREPVQRNRFRIPASLAWRDVVRAWLSPVNDFLEVRSHLFILVRSQLRTLRMRLGVSPTYFPVEFLTTSAEDDRWDVTVRMLRELGDAAVAHGVPTLFVMVPAVYQVDPAELEAYVSGFRVDRDKIDLEQPNRILAERLMDPKWTLFDVLRAFRAAHDEGSNLYGTVDFHLSPEGHQVLTDVLAPEVLKELADAEPGGA